MKTRTDSTLCQWVTLKKTSAKPIKQVENAGSLAHQIWNLPNNYNEPSDTNGDGKQFWNSANIRIPDEVP